MHDDTILPAGAVRETFEPIQLVEIELANEIKPIVLKKTANGHGYTSAIALVRLHGEPLGTVLLQAGGGIVTSFACGTAIQHALGARIAAHLEGDGITPSSALDLHGILTFDDAQCQIDRRRLLTDPPFVTVVVATHDRPGSLYACLKSLVSLDYPRYEIVAVLNATPHGVDYDSVLAQFAGDPRVRWVREDVQGACRARNRGIAAAQGDIIAFCDDDVTHDRNWLSELALGFGAGRNVGCVTGLAFPQEIETQAQLWFEQYGGFGAGFSPRVFGLHEHRPDDPFFPYRPAVFGVGTNMAFRSEVIRKLGGFSLALGPGTLVTSGEDYALYYRTIQHGYEIAYHPKAIVYHCHRRDYDSLRDQVYGYAVGYAASLVDTVLGNPIAALNLAYQVPKGMAAFLRAKRQDQHKTDYPAHFARLELQGLLAGPGLYFRSKWHAARETHRVRKRELHASASSGRIADEQMDSSRRIG